MECLALTTTCPACGSEDVTYSCQPECCFNHVCGACLHSFELFTEDLGENLPSLRAPAEERDSCGITVACARCQSLEVYQVSDEGRPAGLVCASCHARLRLGFAPDLVVR